jgi:hypothetical protein
MFDLTLPHSFIVPCPSQKKNKALQKTVMAEIDYPPNLKNSSDSRASRTLYGLGSFFSSSWFQHILNQKKLSSIENIEIVVPDTDGQFKHVPPFSGVKYHRTLPSQLTQVAGTQQITSWPPRPTHGDAPIPNCFIQLGETREKKNMAAGSRFHSFLYHKKYFI